MMRMIALALALGVGAAAACAEEGGDDDKAKAEAPSAAKIQILDPAAHNLVRLDTLTLGSETDSAHMAPKEYRLKSGQGYRLKIVASDQAEYALIAPALFRNIWIRKVEAGGVEIKSATLDEIEFENGGEAELFFVAIRPGTYEFGPKGLMDRGVVGKFIVESAGG
jgi:uncharacterized cupredoxin-like copper-binding protein